MRSTRGSALAPCSSKAVPDGAQQRFRIRLRRHTRSCSTRPCHMLFPASGIPASPVPITRRWFETVSGVSSNDLTLEPVSVIEYIIRGNWLGGARTAQIFGNPAIDGLVLYERNWSTVPSFEYGQWLAGIVLKAGRCF